MTARYSGMRKAAIAVLPHAQRVNDRVQQDLKKNATTFRGTHTPRPPTEARTSFLSGNPVDREYVRLDHRESGAVFITDRFQWANAVP